MQYEMWYWNNVKGSSFNFYVGGLRQPRTRGG
jgi:hypothetical protein